ncbi:MAG: sensor histidine kinase [Candidatus Methylacidiphilales bacterium]
MNAAICLTLAGMHFLIWLNDRKEYKHLIFCWSAFSAMGCAAVELMLMHAETTGEFAVLLHFGHVLVWMLVVSVIFFAHLYLQAGKPVLLWSTVAVRSLALIIGLVSPYSMGYGEITSLKQITILGESVSMAVGTPHPLAFVPILSSVLLFVFMTDVTVTVWRRRERRRAIMLCGSMVFFVLMATVHSALIHRGVIHSPFLVSFAFLAIILAMAYELSRDVIRASRLVHKLQASEADLRESEQRLSMATDAASLGVWVRDFTKDEFWASESWRRIFGVAADEAIHFDNLLGRIHPEDLSMFRQKLEKAVGEGGTFEAEFRLMFPDGGTRWIASRGHVKVSEAGRPLIIRGVSVDITTRRNAEQEMHDLRRELAHAGRVTMLGQLSTALAHELSQPLGAILRNAEAAELFLAMNPPDLAEVKNILADIRKDDQRAGEVIARMRALLRRGEIEPISLEAALLVSEVIALVREDAATRGVVIESVMPANLPAVWGDRVQFQQVLLNLILNGMDALSERQSGDRHMAIRATQNGAEFVEIAVSDTGPGITEKMDRIFEPFFTTKSDGMGIGLSISRTMIEAQGGRIWATNNDSIGATFHFSMPIDRAVSV